MCASFSTKHGSNDYRPQPRVSVMTSLPREWLVRRILTKDVSASRTVRPRVGTRTSRVALLVKFLGHTCQVYPRNLLVVTLQRSLFAKRHLAGSL